MEEKPRIGVYGERKRAERSGDQSNGVASRRGDFVADRPASAAVIHSSLFRFAFFFFLLSVREDDGGDESAGVALSGVSESIIN